MQEPGIVFVDRLAEVVIDGHGVTLEIGSGSSSWFRRIELGLWRRFLEIELRRLNEWDAANRGARVLPFRTG